MELQGKFNVLVVTDENKVENRQVVTGPTVKSFWLIKEGLKPGEKVIYEGLQQVQEGSGRNPGSSRYQNPRSREYIRVNGQFFC